MSKRSRVYAVVGIAAAVAIGTVAAVVVVSGGDGRAASSPAKTLKGRPPLELDLGVRDDAEATALRRAATLYAHGNPADAARIFERYDSVEADVGSALASWPDGTIETLGRLAAAHPESSFVRLHLGFALVLGRPATAGGGRVESGKARPAGHALRRPRRRPAAPAVQPRAADVRARASRRRHSPPAATAPSSPSSPAAAASTTGSGTGSRSSGSGIRSRPSACSRGRPSGRRTTRTPRPRPPSACFDKAPPRAGVLASRPADEAVPARGDRPLPPRARPALARRGQGGAEAAPACGEGRARLQARARGPRLPPKTRLDKIGLPLRKIGRSAYGFRPPRVRQCPPQ